MKKEQKVMYKFIAGFALVIIVFWGCKEDLNKTGLGLLDPSDLVTVRAAKIEKTDIKAYTVTDDKLRTDNAEYNLLGTFNDPVFGKTTADFACQVRLGKYVDFKNATFDSLKLVLLYNELYGDLVTPQRLKVYELATGLLADTNKYYQDINLKALAKGEVLADYTYVPKFKLDSLTTDYGSTKKDPKDTVIQEITFHLKPSLAAYLMAADSLTRSDNDRFLQYFKGLYIEAGDLSSGGTVMRIKTLASGSAMFLYYRKENDTTKYVLNYNINSTSARVSRFIHDYSNTRFASNLDKQNQLDSLIYLQTTGGLSNKIEIPSLTNWRDSSDCAILKAELILQVDTILTDTTALKTYIPPNRLILRSITNIAGTYENLSDYTFSPAYFGGYYNVSDKTYRFNIAKHLQEIMRKKSDNSGYIKDNNGFYLSTDNRNAILRRVVLKGTTSKTGIRLNITYSKIK